MKVCFFGLGSIGKKHLKNLKEVTNNMGIDVEVHAFRTSEKDLDEDLRKDIGLIITDENRLSNDYDIVFITNPTSLHFETIKMMQDKTKHMFIEKPVFDNIKYDMKELKLKKTGVYYVARPLVHSNVIRELKKIIDKERVYSVRVISSSYLPEWRKGIDYRTVYSAKKELGGGVSIDLIHEWDYITYLFGFPQRVFNLHGKFSQLEINSEDLSIYIAEYTDKLIEVHLDYFGRESRRSIELLTENGTIYADFINKKIRFTDGREDINLILEDDMYINEMSYFINNVVNGQNVNDINRAKEVLELAIGGK